MGLVLAPIAALIVVLLIQPDLADALEATAFYFAVPYLIFFPIFRRLTRDRGYRQLAAIPLVLVVGYVGFWFGGLGVTAAYLVALMLPRYRTES